MTARLETRAAGVRIGEKSLLSEIDLEIHDGALAVIVGPNGAGKSTLLALLAGERMPDSGTVLLDGQPISAHSARAQALRRAILPQSSSLQFAFTVDDIARLGAACARDAGSTVDLDDLVDAALGDAGIRHLQHRFVTTLSGGERQRAHLARCLVQLRASPLRGPKILLLDEPTASLDPAHQHHIMALSARLAAEGHAVVAVVHDLNLASAYADHLVMLSDGRKVFDGGVPDGLTRDRLARVFDLDAQILAHPETGRPLVVQLGAAGRATPSSPDGFKGPKAHVGH